MRRLLALTAGSTALLATSAHAAPCRAPAGAVEVVAGRVAAVYAGPAPAAQGEPAIVRHWGCTRGGQRRRLFDTTPDGAVVYAPNTSASQFRLSGTFVATVITRTETHYGGYRREVRVIDLAGRRADRRGAFNTGQYDGYASGPAMPLDVRRLRLGPNGAVAWLQRDHDVAGVATDRLLTLRGTRTIQLDAAPPGGLATVALRGRGLSWRHEGRTRRATLAVPPRR